ncbi:MAG TPA: MFS transporter [Micromonosporaceae bacterium]|nr:MFS transporter [Micromonosporaceae bacterium]
MTLEPYRRVLALPGVRSLLLVALVARLPLTAVGVTLTLHVVLELERGYAAAGLVGAVITVGAGLGAPVLGRLVDRVGLRPMVAVTTVVEALFWVVAPALPYAALLVAALVAGLLALPVFSVVRQSLAALVPEEQRRPAYSLDSMSVELAFMAGPVLAVLVVTTASARTAMLAVGAAIVTAGTALFLFNPPTRSAEEVAAGTARVPRRAWLGPRMFAVLAVCAATTLVLSGTDVAVVAVLRDAGRVEWTGAVLALWGAYSMAGGFVYGGLTRPFPPPALAALLSVLTVPIGLVAGWPWLCLALLPAGALCAPTLASTSDAVSRLVPAGARGEAMGLHTSALTVGLAAGAPLAGAAIDLAGPAWGFVAVGAVGGLLALAAVPAYRRHRGAPAPQVESAVLATAP